MQPPYVFEGAFMMCILWGGGAGDSAEGDPSDYPKISRVIFNRLKIGMPLQLDTTVQYLLKRRGEITLAIKDTKIKVVNKIDSLTK